jgi:DHA1 family bicyclomycin/chloramphenicol resistance-like MFS transporter
MRDMAPRLTLVALVAFSAISTDLYLSGIPGMISDLGVGHAEGQLTLSLFLAGFALGQLVFGPLSDYYGRKPVVARGLALYVLACVGCVFAPSIEALLAARLLQGIAAAAGPVIARAIVRDRFAGQQAARMMALLATAMAMVPLIAPVFGSWLLYWFDWRSQFAALLLFGLATLASLGSIEESCPSIGVGGIALGRVFGQFRECLRSPVFVGYALCGGAAFAGSFAYISSASFIVIELLGVAPQNFGYTFMLAVGGYMSGSYLSSVLVMRVGVLRLLRAGVIASVLGSGLLLCLAIAELQVLAAVIVAVFCCFLGSGMCLSNAQMGAISEFPMSAGGASAVFGFLQTAMASLSGLVVGQAYNSTLMPTALAMSGGALLAVAGYRLLLRTLAPTAGAK